MNDLAVPVSEPVYMRQADVVVFNQLAVKVAMDSVSKRAYFDWLDGVTAEIGALVPGASIAEKPHARTNPPLNTAVYYDTEDYRILPTGALLRTSCNRITHAFCAFKMAENEHSVRRDHRYVFDGDEKALIQSSPTSPAAVDVVRRLLVRTDIEHPGTFLERHYGIPGSDLRPALALEDLRYTFFVWLDGSDALRCSLDRAEVWDLRVPVDQQERRPFSEVELALYPRIHPEVACDPRVVELIESLAKSLHEAFGVMPTHDIKYQRGARLLGFHEA